MRLLVLGGTRFVGRALVDDALSRGWQVTAVHRGLTGRLPDAVTTRIADRTSSADLAAALADSTWDAVVDTWAGAPAVIGESTRLLAGRLTAGLAGPVDVAGRSGFTTTEGLLTACVTATGSDAELVWVDEQALEAAGVQPWTQLPCWAPEGGDFAGFLEADTSLAARTGLVCRPVQETVDDTWRWVHADGMPAQRPDRPPHGLPVDLEQRLLS